MDFRLVLKSVTLNDLAGRYGCSVVFLRRTVSFGADAVKRAV